VSQTLGIRLLANSCEDAVASLIRLKAQASPIPEEAPVTTTAPLSDSLCCISLFLRSFILLLLSENSLIRPVVQPVGLLEHLSHKNAQTHACGKTAKQDDTE